MKAYLVVAVAAVVGVFVAASGFLPFARAGDDTRIVLELTGEQNASVRSEMRKLLVSVADIVAAISENDLAAVEKAGRASGMSMAAQVEVSLKKKLPVGFMKLGKSVHVGFDEIADAAAGGADKDKLVSLLGGQLQRCVACHDTYGLK